MSSADGAGSTINSGEDEERPEGRTDEGVPSEQQAGRRAQSGGLSDWVDALRDMAPYLDLGWRLAGSAAFPPILGYLVVDLWFGTAPWGLLSGAVLGLAAALLQLKRLQEELDR